MKPPDNVIPLAGRKALKGNRPLGEMADDELMLLARGGVAEAFDTLVRRHQAGVLRVAAKLLGQVPLAKDAAQNAFLEIYRYLPHYQVQGRFRRLLYKVVLNQCRMARRSARQESKLHAEMAAASRKNGHLPEEAILSRERRRELERLLSKLSRKLRQVLVLRFAAELSYAEIGEILDVPAGTVKSRIFSGLSKLRRLMKGKMK
jgi:RNA polymerase sigma-70 factor (ECF subfamily)